MTGIDALVLARLQFAFTMACHIVFPAFSIGLASYLAVLEGLWLATGRDVYLQVYKYWLKIFAIVFGMGVVSGMVMSYQFGTNFISGADKTGAGIGPLMGYGGAGSLLPLRCWLPRHHVVWRAAGGTGTAFRRHGTGCCRHTVLGVLDPERQQLDADARRLCDQRGRPIRADRLVEGRLQPLVSIPARAHGAGRVSDYCVASVPGELGIYWARPRMHRPA